MRRPMPCQRWPEASMLGDDYLRKVVRYDFHLLRKKYDPEHVGATLTHNGDY